MAFTDVEICNMALLHIQAKPINSLEENSPAGRACKLFYNSIRQEVLEDFDWSFARQSEVLPIHVEEPDNTQYAYEYIFPSKAIAIRKLTYKSDPRREIDYQTSVSVDQSGSEIRVIWANFPNPLCVYTRDINSNALFSPKFVTAFSYRLAASLANALRIEGRAANMMQFYVALRDEAQMSDGNQFHDEQDTINLADELTGSSPINAYIPSDLN